jgi:hypothetical protein
MKRHLNGPTHEGGVGADPDRHSSYANTDAGNRDLVLPSGASGKSVLRGFEQEQEQEQEHELTGCTP